MWISTLCESVQFQTEIVRSTRLGRLYFSLSVEKIDSDIPQSDSLMQNIVLRLHLLMMCLKPTLYVLCNCICISRKTLTNKISWIISLVVGDDIVKVFGGELYREWIVDVDEDEEQGDVITVNMKMGTVRMWGSGCKILCVWSSCIRIYRTGWHMGGRLLMNR